MSDGFFKMPGIAGVGLDNWRRITSSLFEFEIDLWWRQDQGSVCFHVLRQDPRIRVLAGLPGGSSCIWKSRDGWELYSTDAPKMSFEGDFPSTVAMHIRGQDSSHDYSVVKLSCARSVHARAVFELLLSRLQEFAESQEFADRLDCVRAKEDLTPSKPQTSALPVRLAYTMTCVDETLVFRILYQDLGIAISEYDGAKVLLVHPTGVDGQADTVLMHTRPNLVEGKDGIYIYVRGRDSSRDHAQVLLTFPDSVQARAAESRIHAALRVCVNSLSKVQVVPEFPEHAVVLRG